MPHYKMSDVVVEINDRENNPSESKYERFVGLEHYVSGEVIIRNFGSTERLESTMKVFQSGDILVARRNVYLKRAATVDFDGLTSGDSIVLRPTNYLIGRILPFVLNTDAFWDFADRYSDGTMSKRLSPKTLMKYEFDLPNDDELSLLADTLWAANDTREAYQELLRQSDELVKSQFIELFGDPVYNPNKLYSSLLSDVSEIMSGITKGRKVKDTELVRVPYVCTANVQNGFIDWPETKYIEATTAEIQKYSLSADDILMIEGGDPDKVGRGCLAGSLPNQCIYQNHVFRVRVNKTLLRPEFVAAYILLPSTKNYFFSCAKQTTGIATINKKQLGELQIMYPSLEQQDLYLSFVRQLDKSKFELKQSIANITALMKSLMQQDFSN